MAGAVVGPVRKGEGSKPGLKGWKGARGGREGLRNESCENQLSAISYQLSAISYQLQLQLSFKIVSYQLCFRMFARRGEGEGSHGKKARKRMGGRVRMGRKGGGEGRKMDRGGGQKGPLGREREQMKGM